MRFIRSAIAFVMCITLLPGALAQASQEVEAKIQPGASISTDTGYCTLNWVYDGVGKRKGQVFVGTAAHCLAKIGEPVHLMTTTFGERILTIGKVVFIAPDYDESIGSDYDYAFIKVNRKHLDAVDPAMAGHPEIPSGVAKAGDAGHGDTLQFSGHGVATFAAQPTREQRKGVLTVIDDRQWSAVSAATQGDSGGPLADLTADGSALGIVNTISAGVNGTQPTTNAGLTVEWILRDAASHGFRVRLRSVS